MPLAHIAWHIIAETQRAGEEPNSPPSREYFVVAIAPQEQALQSLRMRKNVADAKLVIIGEATQEFVVTSNISEGDILSVGLSLSPADKTPVPSATAD